jgi:hypothetical protein
MPPVKPQKSIKLAKKHPRLARLTIGVVASKDERPAAGKALRSHVKSG